MQIVMLMGGMATRLGELSKRTPKSMIAINNRPFIDYQFELLSQFSIDKVLLCLGHMGEIIQKHVEEKWSSSFYIDYIYDGPHLKGTGGCLVNALNHLAPHFLLMYGDSYLRIDYDQVYTTFTETNKKALMCILKNDNKWDRSNIYFDNNQIQIYDKKSNDQRKNYIDYGLGVFNRNLIEQFKDHPLPFDLSFIFQEALHENQLAHHIVQKRFFEIGSQQGIEDFTNYITNVHSKDYLNERNL